MRAFAIFCIFSALIVWVVCMPQPQNFQDAVKQAQQMSLIPAGAVVDKTFAGSQVAYFQLNENDRVNSHDLAQALNGVPPEIIANLESQIASAH